jgi:multidrug efflux system outer membrane protein
MTTSQYSATAGVTSFEVDLFGRVRSLTREALEQYFATEEARLSAQITLISEVATQYLNELGLAEQRQVARQTLTAVSASYDLTAMRYNAGTASELDLRTAQAEVQSAQANVAELDREVAQADNALTLLVGEPIPADLPPPGSLTSLGILAAIEAGIPSEILEARPDIREAEYQLKAANADIGAARAAFFPSIELTGSAGSTSSQLSGLFKPGSATWSFAPQVTLPLFAGGRNSANLDVAKVERSIEVANYEKTVQSAFREVSDALVAQTPLDAQVAAVQAQVEAEQARYRLTELRYKNGTDSYLAVLLAQEDLYTAQQNLIATRVTRLTNTVTLYKALGGGILEYSSPRS